MAHGVNSSAEFSLHVADRSQETGCNRSENGKRGVTHFSHLPGQIGSKYPVSPSHATAVVTPLCTRPVVGKRAARSDRPSRVDFRNRPPVAMRVRSGPVTPSVSVDSHTESEPMSVTVGDRSVPPSIGQPKNLTTPNKERCARGVLGKKLRRKI